MVDVAFLDATGEVVLTDGRAERRIPAPQQWRLTRYVEPSRLSLTGRFEEDGTFAVSFTERSGASEVDDGFDLINVAIPLGDRTRNIPIAFDERIDWVDVRAAAEGLHRVGRHSSDDFDVVLHMDDPQQFQVSITSRSHGDRLTLILDGVTPADWPVTDTPDFALTVLIETAAGTAEGRVDFRRSDQDSGPG